jgi:hypothetical protein
VKNFSLSLVKTVGRGWGKEVRGCGLEEWKYIKAYYIKIR